MIKAKNDNFWRIAVSAAVLIICAVCAVITRFAELGTTPIQITGGFAAVLAVTIAAWRFPLRFYITALVFVVFAAPFGSVLNLYRLVPFYDKAVHYLSGILLAEAGVLIGGYIFRKYDLRPERMAVLVFAFFFSCSCAGFWEIYEFLADTFLGADAQGENSNTMGDIISGVLGALSYFIAFVLIGNISGKKEKNKNK